MKKMTVIALVGLLSACATMTPKECKNANWRDIGYSDALDGKSVQLSGHREACAKVKVRPNREVYMSGYRRGSREFCTYESGLQFGKRGKNASNICTSVASGRDFFRGYDKGKQIYDIKKEIDEQRDQHRKIEKKIRKVRKSKEKDSDREIDLLYREKELINREIDSLRRELRRL
jgi:hypothetical protein